MSTDVRPSPLVSVLTQAFEWMARCAKFIQPVFLLATRWYVSWQFLKSGWLKVTNWDSTLGLFRDEYHVPLLPPYAAAVTGAFGELFFSTLLVLGLGGRFGALGLFAVNLMAVISYRQVLLADGFEAALAQHVLWGFMLAVLWVFGNGPLAVDRLIAPWLPAAAKR
jgi:putative oxidoreductase